MWLGGQLAILKREVRAEFFGKVRLEQRLEVAKYTSRRTLYAEEGKTRSKALIPNM